MENTGEVNWLADDAMRMEVAVPVIAQATLFGARYCNDATWLWWPHLWRDDAIASDTRSDRRLTSPALHRHPLRLHRESQSGKEKS
ncbi:MAG: hypothetical protein ACHBNF_08910 [Chromatiales bacterium]